MIYSNTPPAYSFHVSPRDGKSSRRDLPGPGHYDPTIKSAALLTPFFKSPKFSPVHSISPGPGSYDDPVHIGEGPKTFIGPKLQPKYDNAVPGPGAYDLSVDLKTVSPIRFSKAAKDKSYKTLVPGPGEYSLSQSTDGPRWTFSKVNKGMESPGNRSRAGTLDGGRSIDMCILYSEKSPSPGPGSYENPQNLSTSLPGFYHSKSKKEPSYIYRSFSPGPFAYNPKHIARSEPIYGLGKSKKLPDFKSVAPGPGHYDPQPLRTSPKPVFRTRLPDLIQEHKKQLPVPVTIGSRTLRPSLAKGSSRTSSETARIQLLKSRENRLRKGGRTPLRNPFVHRSHADVSQTEIRQGLI